MKRYNARDEARAGKMTHSKLVVMDSGYETGGSLREGRTLRVLDLMNTGSKRLADRTKTKRSFRVCQGIGEIIGTAGQFDPSSQPRGSTELIKTADFLEGLHSYVKSQEASLRPAQIVANMRDLLANRMEQAGNGLVMPFVQPTQTAAAPTKASRAA